MGENLGADGTQRAAVSYLHVSSTSLPKFDYGKEHFKHIR